MTVAHNGSPAARLRIGIFLMLGAMLVFSANDVIGKALVARYPAAQVMFLRSFATLILLAPWLWHSRAAILGVPQRRLHILRATLLALEGFGFYFAIGFLPLADTVTYWLAAPVYVAALAPLMLGERVDWRGWVAVLAGFAGVVLALEPSAKSLTLPALIALAGSGAFAVAMILGRKLRAAPDLTLVGWQIFGAVAASGVGVALNSANWRPVSLPDLGLLCMLGVVATLAHMMVNRAFRHGDAAALMPFQYTLLLWAVLFGAVFFGDMPRPAMLAGAALIVAAGLYLALRRTSPVALTEPVHPAP